MSRRFFWLTIATACGLTACVDNNPTEPTKVDSAPTPVVVEQAVVDANGDNWMVAGDGGVLEMVGGQDGEPNVVTGRFVLGGSVVTDAAAGTDRWILVGEGQAQAVDNNAERLKDVRTILSGETANFIVAGNNGWLVGGGAGRVQLLDSEGEPTTNEFVAVTGGNIVDGAWNGGSWLVGGNGALRSCNPAVSACASITGTIDFNDIRAITTEAEPSSQQVSAWWVFGASSAHRVSAQGFVAPAQTIDANVDIQDAVYVDGNIALGTADGRFGLWDPTTPGTPPSWQNVLGGRSVHKIEWTGTEFVILGQDGWVQRAAANGGPIDSPLQLATLQTATAARVADNRLTFVIGAIGFAEFAAADLSPLRVLTPVSQSAVRASAVGENAILLAGDDGRVQLVDDTGTAMGSGAQLSGNPDLFAASYNGESYIVAGEGGFVQVIDEAGAPQGSSQTQNGGTAINFAAWSGEFYLIGGGDTIQRLRGDGTESGGPVTMTGFTQIHDARWSGRLWLIVGEGANGNAAYATVQRDGSPGAVQEIPNFPGSAFAVEFTGLEFLVGGSGGLIQRVSGEGSTVDSPFEALNGFNIRDVFFNGSNFLVGGDFGAMRRLSPELQPLRAPIALLDQRPIRAIAWTRARGFASGLCISDDFCFQGPCVGGLTTGQCCDSACDRPCDSCFNRDTGEPDGTCAPVVAGKQPPRADGCQRESETSCGRTGECDGAGECAFFGTDIECGEAVCTSGEFTPSAQCDGMGQCGTVTVEDCAPYNSCSSAGCETSCTDDVNCVEGFACVEGECVSTDDPDMGTGGGGGGGGDDGGCTTVQTEAPSDAVLFILLGFVGLLRRRR